MAPIARSARYPAHGGHPQQGPKGLESDPQQDEQPRSGQRRSRDEPDQWSVKERQCLNAEAAQGGLGVQKRRDARRRTFFCPSGRV